MDWWMVPSVSPGALDFGCGAVALVVAVVAAAVPAGVLLRRAPRRPAVPVVGERADETLRHAA